MSSLSRFGRNSGDITEGRLRLRGEHSFGAAPPRLAFDSVSRDFAKRRWLQLATLFVDFLVLGVTPYTYREALISSYDCFVVQSYTESRALPPTLSWLGLRFSELCFGLICTLFLRLDEFGRSFLLPAEVRRSDEPTLVVSYRLPCCGLNMFGMPVLNIILRSCCFLNDWSASLVCGLSSLKFCMLLLNKLGDSVQSLLFKAAKFGDMSLLFCDSVASPASTAGCRVSLSSTGLL